MKHPKMLSIILCFFFLLIFIPKILAVENVNKKVELEEVLEETLLNQFDPYFIGITKGKAYFCEKILGIKRVDGISNIHELVVQLVTYEGAHNKPFDLYVVKFVVKPSQSPKANMEFETLSIKKEENIPLTEMEKVCGR